MKISIAKQLASHAILAAVSLFVSLATFEGILSIAVQKDGDTEEGILDAAIKTAKEESQPSEAQQPRREETDSNEQICKSAFYAVINGDSATPVCVQNPTLRMAQWGPPSVAWFRSVGGEFVARQAEAVPRKLCACLSQQPGYQTPSDSRGYDPIDHVMFENIRMPIVKWSCGDACASISPGERREF